MNSGKRRGAPPPKDSLAFPSCRITSSARLQQIGHELPCAYRNRVRRPHRSATTELSPGPSTFPPRLRLQSADQMAPQRPSSPPPASTVGEVWVLGLTPGWRSGLSQPSMLTVNKKKRGRILHGLMACPTLPSPKSDYTPTRFKFTTTTNHAAPD
jgi:hypothetical protein